MVYGYVYGTVVLSLSSIVVHGPKQVNGYMYGSSCFSALNDTKNRLVLMSLRLIGVKKT